MKRRDFITLVGGAAATSPVAANPQQAAMPVVGFLNYTSPDGYRASARISPRPEGGRLCRARERSDRIPLGREWEDRLPSLAAELVHRQVAVIAAPTTVAALAAKAATTRAERASDLLSSLLAYTPRAWQRGR
jgi:putative tryptophan/tyrosine transport system substrate-binding protein